MQSISICTYSKNRIEHVKGFFSALIPILNPIDEVIYVDYNDPQNSKDYLKKINNPQVKVYEVPGVKYWQPSHAHNCAGINTSKDILFFIDIDIFLTKEIIEFARNNVTKEQFVNGSCGEKRGGVSFGSCAVTKEMYLKINGYEEMFTGYGFEDMNFYFTLFKNKYKGITFPFQEHQNNIVGPHTREDKCEDIHKFNQSLYELTKTSKLPNNFQRTIGYGSRLY